MTISLAAYHDIAQESEAAYRCTLISLRNTIAQLLHEHPYWPQALTRASIGCWPKRQWWSASPKGNSSRVTVQTHCAAPCRMHGFRNPVDWDYWLKMTVAVCSAAMASLLRRTLIPGSMWLAAESCTGIHSERHCYAQVASKSQHIGALR